MNRFLKFIRLGLRVVLCVGALEASYHQSKKTASEWSADEQKFHKHKPKLDVKSTTSIPRFID